MIISFNRIYHFILVMDIGCFFFMVRTEHLNVIHLPGKNHKLIKLDQVLMSHAVAVIQSADTPAVFSSSYSEHVKAFSQDQISLKRHCSPIPAMHFIYRDSLTQQRASSST